MAQKYEYIVQKVDETELPEKLEVASKLGYRLAAVTQSGSAYTLFLEQPAEN